MSVPLSIAVASAIIAGLSFAVAAATFAKGVLEYRRQNAMKRFEKYQEMSAKFLEDEVFAQVREALELGGPALADLDAKAKYRFMGFYGGVLLFTGRLTRLSKM